MHLLYLSNERIPSGYANTIQQMRMCEAFADIGLKVKLIRPFYFDLADKNDSDIRAFYGVDGKFEILTLPTLLSLSKPPLGEEAKTKITIPFVGGASMIMVTWGYALSQLIRGRFNDQMIVYSRNVNSASVFLKLRKGLLKNRPFRLIMEAHAPAQEPMRTFQRLLQNVDGIVSITESLKQDLIQKYQLNEAKIIVEPDGVNLENIESERTSKEEARKKLGLSNDKKLITYCGAILPGRGVELIVDAAAEFDDSVTFLIVGGSSKDIQALKQRTNADRLQNIIFAGFQPPRLMPLYQMAADVLLLPYTWEGTTASCTSPLKLFEYMASGRPIVASDLPVLQEILKNGKNAILVEEGSSHALAEGIQQVLSNEDISQRISDQALHDVEYFSWKKRAERILKFMLTTFA